MSKAVELTMKPAISKINLKRNYNLREAEKRIKDSSHAVDMIISIDWKERFVKADSVVAFSQSSSELGGSFKFLFNTLRLP